LNTVCGLALALIRSSGKDPVVPYSKEDWEDSVCERERQRMVLAEISMLRSWWREVSSMSGEEFYRTTKQLYAAITVAQIALSPNCRCLHVQYNGIALP